MWLLGCHIPLLQPWHRRQPRPERDRKLLLHRKEITRLVGKVAERGLTVVPLKLYFKGGAPRSRSAWRAARSCTTSATLRERESRREMDKAARDGQKSRF